MLKSFAWAFATTIIVTAGTAFAEPTKIVNGHGNALSVAKPIRFVVDSSVPPHLFPALMEAATQVNGVANGNVVEILGYSAVPLQGMDGINQISFDRTGFEDRRNEMTRMTGYWADENVYEVDIRINAASFDFKADPSTLAQSISSQLLRLLK